MACSLCWACPPHGQRSYLVHLLDTQTAAWGRCIVQSECSHGMQEWADSLAARRELFVHDEQGEKFLMEHPRVVRIEKEAAEHLPLVTPVN